MIRNKKEQNKYIFVQKFGVGKIFYAFNFTICWNYTTKVWNNYYFLFVWKKSLMDTKAAFIWLKNIVKIAILWNIIII